MVVCCVYVCFEYAIDVAFVFAVAFEFAIAFVLDCVFEFEYELACDFAV